MQYKDTFISVVQGDLTEMAVDAIVNAANNEFRMGGGVAGVIKKKGGRVIEDEAMIQGPVEVGESVLTSAGNLDALYVIHASTMAMDFRTDEAIIRRAIRTALECADNNKLASIAFPALGCGVGRFPLEQAAAVMIDELKKFFEEKPGTSLKKIIFSMISRQAYDVFSRALSGF